MPRVSVSAIHLCHRCSRLLAYESRGEAWAWQVGLEGSGLLPGSLFHNAIAHPFHKSLASKRGPVYTQVEKLLHGPLEDIKSGLLALLQRKCLYPVLLEQGQQLEAARMVQLGMAVERWGEFLADFLRQLVQSNSDSNTLAARLSRAFCDPERLLIAPYLLPDGQTLEISGQYDALLFDETAQKMLIVEFKGRRAGEISEDLIQVALYGWLIRNSSGLTPKATLLYLEQELPLAVYDAANLERVMQNLAPLLATTAKILQHPSKYLPFPLPTPLDPSLCGRCPFDASCDKDWGPRIRNATTQKKAL